MLAQPRHVPLSTLPRHSLRQLSLSALAYALIQLRVILSFSSAATVATICTNLRPHFSGAYFGLWKYLCLLSSLHSPTPSLALCKWWLGECFSILIIAKGTHRSVPLLVFGDRWCPPDCCGCGGIGWLGGCFYIGRMLSLHYLDGFLHYNQADY